MTKRPRETTGVERADMIGLAAVAQLAYYAIRKEYARDDAELNLVARAIADQLRIYCLRDNSGDHFSRVTPSELENGQIASCGAILEFPGGRPPLRNLSIRKYNLARANEIVLTFSAILLDPKSASPDLSPGQK